MSFKYGELMNVTICPYYKLEIIEEQKPGLEFGQYKLVDLRRSNKATRYVPTDDPTRLMRRSRNLGRLAPCVACDFT